MKDARTHARLRDLIPGRTVWNHGSPCVVVAAPRRITGGWVVDVEHVLWNGMIRSFSACVDNLMVG